VEADSEPYVHGTIGLDEAIAGTVKMLERQVNSSVNVRRVPEMDHIRVIETIETMRRL
jgi:hypothetical protein